MFTRLFSSFDSLWEHVRDFGLAWAVEKIGDAVPGMDAFDRAYIYAICMAYLTGVLSMEDIYHDKWSPEWTLADTVLDSTTDREEAMMVCNNIMHILHIQDPTMRERGTKSFCSNFFCDGEEYLDVWYSGIKLVGGCPVPPQFVRQIEEAVRPYGYCTVEVCWFYSHLTCGNAYNYSRPEPLRVIISCDSERGCEMACQAVKALDLVYDPSLE